MPTIKEFREFFTRHTQVNGGAKPDQETGFPTTGMIGALQKFNRFLKGDYPSEQVFKKLFESITFKLNVEDTSTTTIQGLSRIATDIEARDRTDNTAGQFSNVVKPHHLPDVVTDIIGGGNPDIELSDSTNNGIKIYQVTRIFGSVFRKVFRLEIVTQDSIVIDGTTKKLKLSGDNITPGNNKVYGTNESGIKGWYDSCCVGSGSGTITGGGSITDVTISGPLTLGGSIPANLNTKTGDFMLMMNAQIDVIIDAFPAAKFEYGVKIGATKILTKNFNNTDLSRGLTSLSLNDDITLTGSGTATFYVECSTTDGAIVNVAEMLKGSFQVLPKH